MKRIGISLMVLLALTVALVSCGRSPKVTPSVEPPLAPTETSTPMPTLTPTPVVKEWPKVETVWKTTGLKPEAESGISALFFDPEDPNTLYALEILGMAKDQVWRLRKNQDWECLGERWFGFNEGVWRQISGPKIPPAPMSESLYSGRPEQSSVRPDSEKGKMVWQILSEGAGFAAFAQAPTDPKIIAAVLLISQPAVNRGWTAVFPTLSYPRLFLSIDGGPPWKEVSLFSLPRSFNPDPELFLEPLVAIWSLAVRSDGKNIELFIAPAFPDRTLPKGVWRTTIPLESLPR